VADPPTLPETRLVAATTAWRPAREPTTIGPGGPDLAALLQLEASWPQLLELHRPTLPHAAGYRRQHALSSLIACAGAEMSAALLAQRARRSSNPLSEEVSLTVVVLGGVTRHAAILSLLDGGLRTLAAHWGAETGFLAEATACLGTVGCYPLGGHWPGHAAARPLGHVPISSSRPPWSISPSP
jgi:hypothetical protein